MSREGEGGGGVPNWGTKGEADPAREEGEEKAGFLSGVAFPPPPPPGVGVSVGVGVGPLGRFGTYSGGNWEMEGSGREAREDGPVTAEGGSPFWAAEIPARKEKNSALVSEPDFPLSAFSHSDRSVFLSSPVHSRNDTAALPGTVWSDDASASNTCV